MKASKLVKETKKVAKKKEKVKKSRVAAPKTPVKKETAKKVEKKEAAQKKSVLNTKLNNAVAAGIVKATKWMTEKDIAFLDKYIKKSA